MTIRKVWFPIALIGLIGAVAAWGWAEIPDDARLPTHWNYHGEIDGYGSKTFGVLFPLVAAVALTIFILLVPRFDPRRRNVERSSEALVATASAANFVMLVIAVVVVLEGTGSDVETSRIVFGAVGLMFAVIGNYLPKTRSNFFLGVRTPWTLSSERAWTKTHRLGGHVMFATGVATIAAAVVSASLAAVVLLVGVGADLVATSVYSYVVWKNDPERA